MTPNGSAVSKRQYGRRRGGEVLRIDTPVADAELRERLADTASAETIEHLDVVEF